MEYRLDLNTLLLMLRHSTGSLYSEVQHMPGIKGRCRISLRLERGVIQACAIANEQGDELFAGDAAIKRIQNHVLAWHYREEKTTTHTLRETTSHLSRETAPQLPRELPPRLSLVPMSRSPIPLRRYAISHPEFLAWPRLYRAVYSLIDGKTSVDDIVRLLSREQGTERVLEVIARLQREGLIVFR